MRKSSTTHHWLRLLGCSATACFIAAPTFADETMPEADDARPAAAQEMPAMPEGWTAEDMQKMMMSGTPGEEHGYLCEAEGEWVGASQGRMAADAPVMESKMHHVVTPILGGRYILIEANSQMPGFGPYHGQGFFGYDNVTQQYVGMWIDNFSTGIMHATGERSDDGTVLRWTYEYACPVSDEMKTMTQTITETGPDTQIQVFVGTDPKTGEEFEMMRAEMKRIEADEDAADVKS